MGLEECNSQIRKSQGFAELLDEYTLVTKLGEGGFGSVMLAEHKNSKAKVAIKLIKKAPLAKMYAKCGETFQEVSVLREVTA